MSPRHRSFTNFPTARSAVVFLTCTAPAFAQVGPSTDTTRATLPPLHGESLAFDPDRSRLVVFGGAAELTGTWEWDGTRWRLAADSASSPRPRAGAPMAYDPARRRIVMFGGQPRRAPNAPARLCDTWAFDGRAWALDHDGPCPTDRAINTALAYDTRRGVMLLVDGPTVGADTVLRPTRIWRWTNHAWDLVDSTGPRRQGFSSVAFDTARGVLVVPVLFGGPDAGVWEWDGAGWRHVHAEGPSVRQTYALVYDARSRRTILMGGQGSRRGPYLADAWAWDGTRWTEQPLPSGGAPSGRGGATLHADVRADRLIYFGGYDATTPLAELWIGDDRGWRLWSAP